MYAYSCHQRQAGTGLNDYVRHALAGGGKPNPVYRQVVVVALQSAADGVGRYFTPHTPIGQDATARPGGGGGGGGLFRPQVCSHVSYVPPVLCNVPVHVPTIIL